MFFKLYCSGKYIPDLDTEGKRWPILQSCNRGFYEVMYLLWLLKQRGHDFEVIDSAHLPEDGLRQIYTSVIRLSVAKKYSIRRVFGTKHQSGIRFGVQVPALVVYKDDEPLPFDIIPNQEERYHDVTIRDYLVRELKRTGGTNIRQRRNFIR